MNIKTILVLIVLASILSFSIVSAYENVENNSNGINDGGISVSSSHEILHKLHNTYSHGPNSNENNETHVINSPQDLIVMGYLFEFDLI
ncbi:MAG: hypothetical protein IJP99_05255 [Methanobrevibacter sp.]|uniref:Uncharacterized protein n=1 Tax=Methanobrevibacter millerae TaxID=230361 RepID=A0A8T3V9U9_9EURY|nr:hypothetical protein [Methanobrevibacter millerae]MBE6504507.1 hypothetical protein [Methanobrevibacter millerae]MBR0058723.1 hypothetical protein [Methanobrevibacter sp.]